MHTVTTAGAGQSGSPRRTSRRVALPIVGCLALAGWVGACGSDKDATGVAATTAPPPTTPAIAPTTPVVTRAATTSAATASTATATTSAAAMTAGPPTSLIFRTEHGEVPDRTIRGHADGHGPVGGPERAVRRTVLALAADLVATRVLTRPEVGAVLGQRDGHPCVRAALPVGDDVVCRPVQPDHA